MATNGVVGALNGFYFMAKKKKIYDIFPPGKGEDSIVNLRQEGKRLKKKEKPEKKTVGAIHKSPTPKKPEKKPRFRFWPILIFVILIAGGVFSYFYLAKAEIIINPKIDVLSLEKTVRVTTESETSREQPEVPEIALISGKIFEAERTGEKEFPATGQIDIEKKATGTIRVYNNYHQNQILVENTRFQPPLEKVMYFRTTERIVVPSKGYIDVEVVADQPGEEQNIEPSTFSVPGLAGLAQYYSVYGKSFSSMEGGYIGKSYKVTEKDLENAKENLAQELFSELKNYIKERVPSGFSLLEDAITQELLETSCGAKADDEVSSFKVSAKVKIKTFLCEETELEEISKNYFISNKPPNKELQEESLKIEYKVLSLNWREETADIRLKSSIRSYSKINKDDLRQRLKRKSLQEARDILANMSEIDKMEVKLWPFWVRRIPGNTKKIDIIINLDKNQQSSPLTKYKTFGKLLYNSII